MFVEPLITKAKNDTVHARRLVAREIHDRAVLQELFGEVIEKIGDRKGGYTRIVKLGTRPGDGSDMAILELVDYNLGEDTTPKTKTAKEEPKVEETEVVENNMEVKEEEKAEAVEAEVVTEEVTEEKAEDTTEEEKKEDK
jgi:large subunit ribosomal protein L17